ncbi:MAG: hypothetical protein AMXMBFR13_09980 [Phycisphaerae bacterium]
MRAEILRGSKQEIAETVIRMAGEVREAIVFVEEPSDAPAPTLEDDIFAEMDPFVVRVGGADYSREGLYSGTCEGE